MPRLNSGRTTNNFTIVPKLEENCDRDPPHDFRRFIWLWSCSSWLQRVIGSSSSAQQQSKIFVQLNSFQIVLSFISSSLLTIIWGTGQQQHNLPPGGGVAARDDDEPTMTWVRDRGGARSSSWTLEFRQNFDRIFSLELIMCGKLIHWVGLGLFLQDD